MLREIVCMCRLPLLIAAAFAAAPLFGADPVTIDLLPPGPGNPRNTEGSFVKLKDGRLMFVYSRFSTNGPADSGAATLAARYSKDDGITWTAQDQTVVENEGGMNVMSASLLRLRSGEIALFYCRKDSMVECRPWMRTSRDEGKTWSRARLTIPEPGYYVLNNDRVVQLRSGRLLMPVALHRNETPEPSKFNSRGVAMCYFSDDMGRTWRRSRTVLENPAPDPNGLQEPGVVVLKDGRLLMYMRTGLGSQYYSYSKDDGDTWSPVEASTLLSPLSPASIKRIPKTGDLLVVWNDHSNVSERVRNRLRTPLTVAISRDEGKTWEKAKNIADDPEGWYCYTAIHFAGDRVILGYNAGGSGLPRLSRLVMTYFGLDWLYR
ncbi:MAG: exo-alpha-sialidase [Bryobacteraceae bacterium]|nr:exo-alpha-sialidase [Bryobacteraceae bacterium]